MKRVKRKVHKARKENTVKKAYRETWNFIKDSRNFILLGLAIFLISALIGILYPELFQKQITEYLERVFDKVKDYNFLQTFGFILKNNISSSFFVVLWGILLGIFPAIITVINGYVLGFVAVKSAEIAGPAILLRLIPHGIFELPAIFISIGIGIRLGLAVFRERENYRYVLRETARVFILWVVPLLIVAGIIEAALIIFSR